MKRSPFYKRWGSFCIINKQIFNFLVNSNIDVQKTQFIVDRR
jgi:hypothetical protein